MKVTLVSAILLITINVVVSQSVDERLTLGLNQFSVSLFKRIALQNYQQNVFTSPFGTAVGLTALELAARGDTEKEIFKLFDLEMIGMRRFPKLLSKRVEAAETNAGLSVANYLLATDSIVMKPDVFERYKSEIQSLFDTQVDVVDFYNNWYWIEQDINSRVSQETNGIINQQKLAEYPDQMARGVLLNNAYMSKGWLTPFYSGAGTVKPFWNAGYSVWNTNFMNLYGHSFNYGETTVGGQQTEILELPFRNSPDDLTSGSSMVIILPREKNGLTDMLASESFESDLTNLFTTPGLFEYKEVNVHIPRFSISSDYSMKDVLQELGVNKVFTGSADLSRLAGYLGLSITDFRQKSVIDINEAGADAASLDPSQLTGDSLNPAGIEFVADHPFIFAILDRTNAQILFLGKLELTPLGY